MAALTENSTDNFWLDLINWSNEEDDTPTRRWNLFQTWLLQNDDVGLSAQERSKKNAAFLHGLGIVANEFNKFRGFFNNYANLIDECQQKINFKGLQFEAPISFKDAKFLKDTDFSSVNFFVDVDFSECIFKGHTSFEGTIFNGKCSFKNAKFSEYETKNLLQTNFSNAEFYGTTDFSSVKFYTVANFSSVEFCNDVKFNDVKFKQNTSFRKTEFKGKTSFINTKFLGGTNQTENRDSNKEYFDSCAAYFENATFENATFKQVLFQNVDIKGEANFQNSKFSSEVDFCKVNFEGDAIFNKATLSQRVIFKENTKFNKEAHFNEAQFMETANFEGADFYNHAYFNKAIFNNTAMFNGTFNGRAEFEGAKFKGVAFFSKSTFNQGAYFISASFEETAYYREVMFQFGADFSNIRTKAPLNFNKAIFETYPPNTFGTTLHEATSFLYVKWPKAKKETADSHIQSYERLRIQAQSLGMVESRNIFIQKELECRAIVAEGIDKLLRNAYGLISKHGTSIGRPLLCLCGLFFIILLIWIGYLFPEFNEDLNRLDIFKYLSSKAIPFTKLHFVPTEPLQESIKEDTLILWLSLFILSVASPILLFLAGLGLRSKFRMSL